MHIPYLLNYISENQGSPNWSKGFNQPQSGPYSPGWALIKIPDRIWNRSKNIYPIGPGECRWMDPVRGSLIQIN